MLGESPHSCRRGRSEKIEGTEKKSPLSSHSSGISTHNSALCFLSEVSLYIETLYDQPRHHIKRQRHYFATKVHLVKAMVFPVIMYGCESWTIKKAEHRRIGAFELWCWRRLLRVPLTARKSNQSILKKISPGCSLEGLMLKLKLQYFGHLIWRADSLEKTLMLAGGEGGDRGWDSWMASPTQWTWVWVDSGSWWWTGRPGVLQSMGSQRVRHNWETELKWVWLF